MFHNRAWVAVALLLLTSGCGNGSAVPDPGPEGIDLPRVGTSGRAPGGPGTIRLDVDADGRIMLGEKGPLSLPALR